MRFFKRKKPMSDEIQDQSQENTPPVEEQKHEEQTEQPKGDSKAVCEECNGRGLKSDTEMCQPCEGSGKVV